MAKEDDAAALLRREEQKSLAPRVGVKPTKPKKTKGGAEGTPAAATRVLGEDADGVDDDKVDLVKTSGPAAAPGAAPRPGQRPQSSGGQRTRPAQKGGGGGQSKKKKRKR